MTHRTQDELASLVKSAQTLLSAAIFDVEHGLMDTEASNMIKALATLQVVIPVDDQPLVFSALHAAGTALAVTHGIDTAMMGMGFEEPLTFIQNLRNHHGHGHMPPVTFVDDPSGNFTTIAESLEEEE